MGLANVIADIASRLPAGVPVFVGAKFVYQDDAPPRIVFVPVRTQYGAPTGQGGDGVGNPRPLKGRKIAVDVHVWGATFDATELLEAQVMNAVHDSTCGSYQAESADYEFEAGSVSQAGSLLVMHLTFFCPITRVADATAVVLTSPNYVGMQSSAEVNQ